MKRSDFEALTTAVQDAHSEFMTFMEPFIGAPTSRRYMTPQESLQAYELYKRKQGLEDRWLSFIRSPEPIEEG